MSRIGKQPVKIPSGVKVSIRSNTVVVEGPLGKMTETHQPEVEVRQEDDQLVVLRKNDAKRSRAFHGLYRNLLNNMVTGVSSGFRKGLVINGVGYRAEVRDKVLVLNLGFTGPIEYPIPEGVSIQVEANTRITVNGYDKQRVGQVCAEIRSFRPPEPYKGKGVRYESEIVRRKIGKSGIK